MKGVFFLLVAISVVAIDFDAFYEVDDEDRNTTKSPISTQSPISTKSPITTASPSEITTTTTPIPNTPIPTTSIATTPTPTETTTTTTGTLTSSEQNNGWNEELFWNNFDVILKRKFKEWQEEQASEQTTSTKSTTTSETTTTTSTTTDSINDGDDWFADFPSLPQFPEEKEILADEVGSNKVWSGITTIFR